MHFDLVFQVRSEHENTSEISAAGIALAAAAVVAAIPATASLAASGHHGRSAAAVTRTTSAGHLRIAQSAADNCISDFGTGVYCVFRGTYGQNLCWGAVGSIPNWNVGSGYDCRNQDESFANESGGPVRLYYSPNYQGAWACVNSGWFSNDLNKDVYTFTDCVTPRAHEHRPATAGLS